MAQKKWLVIGFSLGSILTGWYCFYLFILYGCAPISGWGIDTTGVSEAEYLRCQSLLGPQNSNLDGKDAVFRFLVPAVASGFVSLIFFLLAVTEMLKQQQGKKLKASSKI